MGECPGKTQKTNRKKHRPWPLAAWLAAAAALAVLLSLFVLRVGFVNGLSMEDSLRHGQLILIWRLGYRPVAGDVVATSAQNAFGRSLTKRVVATEGQTVEISGGRVWVDGALLEEPYLKEEGLTQPDMRLTLPAGTCFLMGDNRSASRDSREIGPIAYGEVLGRVIWPALPPG